MPRARNIKPSFFSNDQLAEIDPLGRLLFIATWCLADREGRLEDRPKKIGAEALPYDECDIDELLDALAKRGFIRRYSVGEIRYIEITNFLKHQNPHCKEKLSAIPAPGEHGAGTVLVPAIPEQAGLIPDSGLPDSGLPDSGLPEPGFKEDVAPVEIDRSLLPVVQAQEPTTAPQLTQVPLHNVFDYWQHVMGCPQAKLTQRRSKAIQDRLREGYTVEQIRRAIDGCKASAWHQGINDRGRVYNDIELICRSGEKVEAFLGMTTHAPARSLTAAGQQTAQNMQRWLDRESVIEA
jgi:hypothetical protein